MKHDHKCIRCKTTWECKRSGMDDETMEICASHTNKPSICDKCMELIDRDIVRVTKTTRGMARNGVELKY